MSGRLTSRTFPQAPTGWDASSREAWNKLVQVLEGSSLFDQGRRTREQFVLVSAVSAPTSIDASSITLPELAAVVVKMLEALKRSPYFDVRTVY